MRLGVRHAYAQQLLVVVHDRDAEPASAVVARDAAPGLAVRVLHARFRLLAFELGAEVGHHGRFAAAFRLLLAVWGGECFRLRRSSTASTHFQW